MTNRVISQPEAQVRAEALQRTVSLTNLAAKHIPNQFDQVISCPNRIEMTAEGWEI